MALLGMYTYTCDIQIYINTDVDNGAVSMPLPFQCSIKPRSKDALRLVQETD